MARGASLRLQETVALYAALGGGRRDEPGSGEAGQASH